MSGGMKFSLAVPVCSRDKSSDKLHDVTAVQLVRLKVESLYHNASCNSPAVNPVLMFDGF